MDTPQQAPAGWYHDGGGWLRWWDGTRWTEHRAAPATAMAAQPPQRGRGSDRRLIAGCLLLATAGLAFIFSVFSIMGDPYPISRTGVATDGDGFAVANAVCSGERLREVTLSRRTETGPWVVLWQISGDAPLPDRLAFGATPAGMRTGVQLDGLPPDDEALDLQVVTSELDHSYSMEFALRDVPADGVLSFGTVYTSTDDFERAMFDDTSCGDPDGKRGAGRFAAIVLAVGAAAGVAGVVLVARSKRRA